MLTVPALPTASLSRVKVGKVRQGLVAWPPLSAKQGLGPGSQPGMRGQPWSPPAPGPRAHHFLPPCGLAS